jgi:hypothetical protein
MSEPRRDVAYPVRLGASFGAGQASHHSLRYSFKPSSADFSRRGKVLVRGPAAEARVPGETAEKSFVFRGKAETHKASECVLVCRDGSWTLERLHYKVLHLKAERSESTVRPPSVEPAAPEPAVTDNSSDADVEASDLFGEDA